MVEQAPALYLYIEDASRAVRFLSAADEVESACTKSRARNRFLLLQRRIWTAGGTSPTCRQTVKVDHFRIADDTLAMPTREHPNQKAN